MRRRVSTLPLLLLLAAMASPALGSSRSVESLRGVVAIAWLNDQDAPQSTPVDQTPRRLSGAASSSLVLLAL